MAIRKVIVHQNGAFWSYEPLEWARLCYKASVEGGHTLDDKNRLQRKPAYINRERWSDRETDSFWTSDVTILLVEPLDWEQEDYQESIASILEG